MIRDWRSRLNKRVGETIFLSAQRDYITGDLRRMTPVTWLAYVISALVLTTPLLMMAAGVAIAVSGFPHILLMIVAAVFIGVGWWLCPKRAHLPAQCFERSDLPKTFALLDQISSKMKGPQITKILIDEDFNASVSEIRGERILTIGALLWAGLRDDQRIAVLAHETAHLVNNDPTRGGFVGAALETLAGWHAMFSPDVVIDEYGDEVRDSMNVIGALITGSLRVTVELVWSLLERLSYLPQQRAEYLADALAAEVAGRTASTEALECVELTDRIGLKVARLGMRNLPTGLAMLEHLASAVRDASEAERAAVLTQMRAADHAIDAVHPPTAFRIAFIEMLPIDAPQITAANIDLDAVTKELEPHLAKIGTQIAQSLVVQ